MSMEVFKLLFEVPLTQSDHFIQLIELHTYLVHNLTREILVELLHVLDKHFIPFALLLNL
jgi:hypothetical protein